MKMIGTMKFMNYEYEYTYTHTHTEVTIMYINPFLAGILATIGTEIVVLFTAAIVAAIKRVKKYGD